MANSRQVTVVSSTLHYHHQPVASDDLLIGFGGQFDTSQYTNGQLELDTFTSTNYSSTAAHQGGSVHTVIALSPHH